LRWVWTETRCDKRKAFQETRQVVSTRIFRNALVARGDLKGGGKKKSSGGRGKTPREGGAYSSKKRPGLVWQKHIKEADKRKGKFHKRQEGKSGAQISSKTRKKPHGTEERRRGGIMREISASFGSGSVGGRYRAVSEGNNGGPP